MESSHTDTKTTSPDPLSLELLNVRKKYEDSFNSGVYLSTYYDDINGNDSIFQKFVLNNLHNIFTTYKVTGKKLLDIGTGPSIVSIISASRYFEDIYLSDFCKENRAHLKLWVNNDNNKHNWDSFFNFVSQLEGTTTQEITTRLRNKIVDIVYCDVLSAGIIENNISNFDCITTSLCLETACVTEDHFRSAIKNIYSLLNDTGYLIIIGDLQESTYTLLDGTTFKSLNVTKQFLENTLTQTGFMIKKLITLDQENKSNYYNANGHYIIVANKQLEN